jgi:predicted secreted protein
MTDMAMRRLAVFGALWAAVALCHASEPTPAGTLIDLAAEASRTATNDLAQATVFAAATDNSPGELAKKVNNLIASALRVAKPYAAIKTRTGTTFTQPNYGRSGRIEGWNMRSELHFETRDTAALSELLGKLQTTLGVGQIVLAPAPETRQKAEDGAMLDAIAAFRAKAKVVADALGKPYRIRQMSIQGAARPPIMPFRRSAMVAAVAEPAPIEAGESTIGVTVSGQIELMGDVR